ncbi:MAG: hypothetical protein V9G04_04620 [Nocardioides sp.]|jgi:hypothetical protein
MTSLILIRTAAITAVLVVAYLIIDLTATKGDPNIGAGLMIFAALVVISVIWAFFDGRRQDLPKTLAAWTIVALVVSVGWLVTRAILEAGDEALELILADLFTIPFTVGLILAPALLGAVLGRASLGTAH